MRTLLPLALTLVLLAPLAAAQHGHLGSEGLAFVLRDGPASGRAVVGAPTHFGFALLDAQGAPVVHQDASFLVTLDNVTVFATNDTHEYDGLFSFDVAFGWPGHYVVTATSGKMAVGAFEGDAVPPSNVTDVTIVAKAEGSPDSNLLAVVVDVQDAAGATVPHTDAILEWRSASDGLLVARYHTHVHDAPMRFTQGFDAPGDYVLHVTAYKAFATGRSTDVPPVVADFTWSVGALAAPALPTPPAAAPAPLEPKGPSATAGELTLHGMYDPQNQVAMGFPVRVSGLASGNDSLPRQHVDFGLRITGPRGLVFASDSLHEYDGHLEHVFVPRVPGVYDAQVTANDGGPNVTVPLQVHVLPPVLSTGPLGMGSPGGPAVVEVQGLDEAVAGEPVELTFSVMGASGPIQHSEVDVTLAQKGKPETMRFKLHTHDSGLTKATVVFPEAGDWIVRVDPLPTDLPPVAFQGPDGPGMGIAFAAKVAQGAQLPAAPASTPADGARPVPGAPLALAGLAVVAVAILLRRR